MNKMTGACLMTAALLCATSAQAQNVATEMRPYVSGMFSYVFEEDDRDALIGAVPESLQEGKGVQLSAGKAINQWLGIEIAAFGHNYTNRAAGGADLRDYGGKLDGLFFYSRNPSFSPYFGVGVGGIQTDVKGSSSSSTDPFADVGLGFMKFFEIAGTDLGFRGDLRYRHVFFDEDAFGGANQDEVGEAVLKFGIVVPLGTKPASEVVKPKPAACVDSDGDGICDTADLCPETLRGTPVDAKGCPVEKSVKGNPNQKFEDLHFAFDKSELTDYAKVLLDGAAGVIANLGKKYPALKVDVSGHTDSTGTDGYNQGLSERRANVVKQYLLRKGVDAARITTQAYGETRPKATNDTDEGRALNRRSEVRTREE